MIPFTPQIYMDEGVWPVWLTWAAVIDRQQTNCLPLTLHNLPLGCLNGADCNLLTKIWRYVCVQYLYMLQCNIALRLVSVRTRPLRCDHAAATERRPYVYLQRGWSSLEEVYICLLHAFAAMIMFRRVRSGSLLHMLDEESVMRSSEQQHYIHLQ
jgi:hypothetical protein